MIAWMIYCLIASALLVVAGGAAEWLARLVKVPVRWTWGGAMAIMAALAVAAPLRQASLREIPDVQTAAARIETIPLQASIDAVSRGLPSSAMMVASVGWITTSAVLLLLIVGVHARLRRARHAWPLAELHGARVRVSPQVGPVVIGFRIPEIIVPRWLLARTADEQRLIVTHEAEHVRAKDTLLLGGGVVVAALMPWNPFVWYMFSRLRLAVEFDCDARVLERGATVESYGSLLIEVASHAMPLRFVVPALANSPSHLHERIIAMKHIVPKFARVRAGIIGVLGVAALLAACEAKMPTSAEVERMDVGAAERRLSLLMPTKDSIAEYVVDQKTVTREQAMALKADTIVTMNVVGGLANRSRLLISTRNGPRQDTTPIFVRGARGGALSDVLEEKPLQSSPLILINGVRSTPDALRALDRNTIANIDVIKGRAVKAEYPGFTDAELAGGLIRVVTKPAGSR